MLNNERPCKRDYWLLLYMNDRYLMFICLSIMNFKAILENFNTRLWSYHVKVPGPIAKHFLEQGNKRVICTINDLVEIQSGIMPGGDGMYFININKKIRDKLKIAEGSQLAIDLKKDESEFGMTMPEEFAEVLAQDAKGREWFDNLTPGKKRNLIYIAGQVKNVDLRIHRSMVMIEHLKRNQGKIDFKVLNASLKASR